MYILLTSATVPAKTLLHNDSATKMYWTITCFAAWLKCWCGFQPYSAFCKKNIFLIGLMTNTGYWVEQWTIITNILTELSIFCEYYIRLSAATNYGIFDSHAMTSNKLKKDMYESGAYQVYTLIPGGHCKC